MRYPAFVASLTSDPTFTATALALGLAVVVVLVAATVRQWRRKPAVRGDEANDGAPQALYEQGAGRVSIMPYRRIDLIGVAWIGGIYVWLSLAQVAASAGADVGERTIGMADLWVSILFQGFMATIVVFVMWPRLGPVDWLGLRPASWRSVLMFAPISVGLMWIVFAILQGVGYVNWIESLGVETMQESVRTLRSERDFPLLGLMGFTAVVVAPVCEEIIFRGYLYGVAKRFCGPFAAALATSLAFAAAHASLMALLPLALFGLLLAWLYERTGSIWAPIAAHACFNAATVTIQLAIR